MIVFSHLSNRSTKVDNFHGINNCMTKPITLRRVPTPKYPDGMTQSLDFQNKIDFLPSIWLTSEGRFEQCPLKHLQ